MEPDSTPFPCPYCEFVALSKFDLRRHLLSTQHTKAEPSINMSSGESSSNGVQMIPEWMDKKPRKSGQPEKKFPCTNCEMSFSKSFNLKRHFAKKHLEPKVSRKGKQKTEKVGTKFKCPGCSDTFSKRFNLRRHAKKAHPEISEILDEGIRKTVYCYICGVGYCCSRLHQLCRHVQSEHKIPLILFEEQINNTDQFNSLISDLKESFSATLVKKVDKGGNGEDMMFRCNHSSNIVDLDKIKKAPCTFYFKVQRVGSKYNIFGCRSHFGHQVEEINTINQHSTINPNNRINLNLDDFDALDNELGFLDSIPNEYLDDLVKVEPDSNNMLPFDANFIFQPANPNDQILNHIQESIKNHSNSMDNDTFQQFNQFPGTSGETLGENLCETLGETSAFLSGNLCKYGSNSTRMSSNVTEEYLKKLSTLQKLESNAYRANFLRSPTGKPGNAYGGLLFAQSLQAAQSTVDKKFIPHSMHCFFILNVDSTNSVDYKIQNVRDGRSFSTRYVTAEQNGKIAMSSQVSFCVKEEDSIKHQLNMPNVPGPETLIDSVDFCKQTIEKYEKGEIELSPNTVHYLNSLIQSSKENVFQVKCTDPMRYYGLDKKKSIEPYYFWIKAGCKLSEDPDEHRFLIAYISDFSLASVSNRPHASLGYVPSMVLSLDHTVHFHEFNYKADEWILYENWSSWASHGRAFSEGRMWTRDGKLILSVTQESLSRTRGERSCI